MQNQQDKSKDLAAGPEDQQAIANPTADNASEEQGGGVGTAENSTAERGAVADPSPATAPPAQPAEEPSAVEEPSAKEEPSAVEGPPAKEEPSANKEPSAKEEPSAVEEPSATKEPSANKEPSAIEEPSAKEKPAAKNDQPATDTTADPELQAQPTPEAAALPASEPTTEPVPEPVPEPAKVPFSQFNLVPTLARAIADLGFEYCTPIQAQSLRYTLVGYDVTGKAQTGTGKTAAFLITIINDLLRNPQQGRRYIGEPRALVLAPTRELVMQIANDAVDLCKHSGLHVVTLVGGEDYQRQLRAVDKKPVDIVVATPGRLIDFLQNDHLYLGLIELLVIDEADRMLDMGFIPQVRNIVARTPHKDCRQTLLFSATFTPEILELTSRWAMDPVMIEIAPERVATETVEQIVYLVTTEEKYNLLYNLIGLQGSEKVIVFSNRRDQVRKLADNLHRHGVNCGMLSGEIAQKKRIQTLEGFRDGKIKVLVATDVAGRGLHIDDVTHVINYTLPEEAEDYVHRIGRTGRAGAVGTSISFACEEDSFLLPNIEEKLGQKLPCVHPDQGLLAEPPAFTRASRFKDEGKPANGRGSRGGSRSGGNRSRSRN